MAMANFFSKYFSEIALLATAVLWAGCGNVDDDSKNEKSVSNSSNSFGVTEISNSVESTESAALQNVTEKDDSLANEISKDSLDANAQTVVLLDSAKQLEVQRTRDSLMKVFFPIERSGKDCQRFDTRGILKCLVQMQLKEMRRVRKNFGENVFLYGVVTSRDDVIRYLNSAAKGRVQEINESDIVVVNDSVSAVLNVVRQRSSTVRLIYNMFLKKNPEFNGTVVLKIKINLNGFVENVEIDSSTTGYDEFDEELKKTVKYWNFGEKNVQGTFKIPFTFYKD